VKNTTSSSGSASTQSFTPEEFARFLKEDTRRWTDIIRASGIKVEQ